MKYKLESDECEYLGEWGIKLSNAPYEWYMCTTGKQIAHDIVEHNIKNQIENLTLDEFRALGVYYNNRDTSIDYDIISLFEGILIDYDEIDPAYLEYHYGNEFTEMFESILDTTSQTNQKYYSHTYPHLTSEELITRAIKCCSYYFKQGCMDKGAINKSYSFYSIAEAMDWLIKRLDTNVPETFTLQVVFSKSIVRIYDEEDALIYTSE